MNYRQYWNDEEAERSKPWWIESPDDDKLLRFLRVETNLEKCFRDGLAFAGLNGGLQGRALDLAAGVCWTSAILSRCTEISEVFAVDYSEHRVGKIAPLVFQQLEADKSKIVTRCDDISTARWDDRSFNFVVFCQALYMSAKPFEILRDVWRILKPGGMVLIACEHISPRRSIRTFLKSLRQGKPFSTPVDKSGRHQYDSQHYEHFLKSAGFGLRIQELSYPTFKDSQIPARNYVGVKGEA